MTTVAELGYSCFWLGVAWMIYVYAGYPLVLSALAKFSGRRHLSDEKYLPKVSVLMAARNEEQDIGWKLSETLDWDYPVDRLEILVASDASDDRTDEIVTAFRDPRVHL